MTQNHASEAVRTIRSKTGIGGLACIAITPVIQAVIDDAMLALREENERLKAEVLSWCEGVEIDRKPARELGEAIAELEQRAEAAEAKLARIKAAADADAADLAVMRDGTKLTRHGLVQCIAAWKEDCEEAQAKLATAEAERDNQFKQGRELLRLIDEALAERAKALESATVWKNRALMLSDVEAERDRLRAAAKEIAERRGGQAAKIAADAITEK